MKDIGLWGPRRLRTILLWGAPVLVVYALVGFFAAPPILKSVLTQKLGEALHRDVSIREVRVNPFTLSATLRGFTVTEPKSPETFASFEELYLNLEASSLFRWGVVLREIRLTKPFLRVVRRHDDSYNFSDLLEGREAQPSAPAKPLRFSLNNIRIIDGAADFQDEPVQTRHTARELHVGIPFLSNIPSDVESFVQPGLSAVINGTRYVLQGQTRPFHDTQETTLDVNITDLDLPRYLAYVPKEFLTFTMPSGRLDAKLAIVFVRQRTAGHTLAVKGDIGLRELAVDDTRGNPVVRIPSFEVGLTSVEPLVRKAHLARIALQSPELTIRREQTGTTNLETLLPKRAAAEQAGEKAPKTPSEAFVLDVDEIRVAGAKVLFSDLATSMPFKTTLNPIDLTVRQLSNRPDVKGTYRLAVKTEAKEAILLEGNLSLTPVLVEGKVEAKSIPLKKYAPYYTNLVMFDLQDGIVDVATNYRLGREKDTLDVKLAGLSSTLRALRLKPRNGEQEFLTIPLLAVKNTGLDLSQREVSVGEVTTERGGVLVSRSRDGEVNLVRLLPRTSAAVSSLAEGPESGPAPVPDRPWLVTAGAISVNQYRIQVTDEAPHEPVSLVIEDLNLKAQNLSTAPDQTGKASLTFRLDNGTFSSEGSVGLTPVVADLQLNLKELDIRPFQPYFTDRVKIVVTSGRLSTSGRLTLSIKEPTGLQATYAGDTVLGKFAAIDKASSEDALKWESFTLRDLSAGYNPLQVRAKKVSLTDFFARILMQPNGRLNLQDILKAPEEPKTAEPPKTAPDPRQASQQGATPQPAPGEPRDIQIEEVTLQGGRIQFTDRSLTPNYSMDMMAIGGRVSGLSSEQASRAEVELRGTLNNSAPLEITGEINPLTQDLYADLRVRFTGMDLSQTSPYSARFVGYPIQKGKLSSDLRYLIDKRKLESENNVFIDQFTFGEKV